MVTEEELRQELAGLGVRGPGFRYPEGFGRRAAIHVRHRLSTGDNGANISRSLGIPWTTLSRWLEEHPVSPVQGLVPVRLSPQEGVSLSGVKVCSPMALISPRGYRLEGLGLEQAVELLRRLG